MKMKVINSIFFIFVFVFSVVFGIKLFNVNTTNSTIDSNYNKAIMEAQSNIDKNNSKGVSDMNSQYGADTKPTTGKPTDGSEPEINFTNFSQMFKYAIDKYNNANYIQTYGNGQFTLSGNVAGLMTLNNQRLSMSFLKQKNAKEKKFEYSLNGKIDNLPFNNGVVGVGTVHYTNGSIYEYYAPTIGYNSMSESQYLEKLGWTMTELFHLPTDKVIKSIPEENIIWYYDAKEQQYVADIEINTATFNSNYSKLLQNIANGSVPPKFNKINIKMYVDKTGSFKRISYVEDFSLNMKVLDYNLNGTVQAVYNEYFQIINTSAVKIDKPNFKGMK